SLGFLDASTGRTTHMQPDLSRVYRWEEIGADQGKQKGGRAKDEHHERGHNGTSVVQGPDQHAAVESSKFFELPVESVVDTPDQIVVNREAHEHDRRADDQRPTDDG